MYLLLRMTAERLFFGLITLLIVSIIIFSAVELLPGDLAQEILGQSATPEAVAAFRRELGLDQAPWIRYLDWLAAISSGDFGRSLANGREISELMSSRLGNTLFLASYAALIAIPVSLILGILAALYRNSWFDRLTNLVTLSSISFPEFFIAYILILFFSVKMALLPSLANISPEMGLGDKLLRTLLPALTLTLVVVAHMMRMTRAAIINVLSSSYIEMAKLKGMSPLRIVVCHALPNALAPIINVIALNLAYLVVGVVVVEVVFVYPGLGQLLVDSVSKRDVTVVQAASLIFAGTFILLNLLADLMSIVTNPRLFNPR
ncbi:MAG: ABC transporter permease [Oceanospirillaceae bacterium]